ncbi:E3 ubiquitin-protein ligase SIS3 [Glycine soja]
MIERGREKKHSLASHLRAPMEMSVAGEIVVLLLETYVPGFRPPLWCLPRHQPRRSRGGPSFNTALLLLPRVSLNQFLWPSEASISSGTMTFSCSCSPQVDYTTVFVFRVLMFVDNGLFAGMGL